MWWLTLLVFSHHIRICFQFAIIHHEVVAGSLFDVVSTIARHQSTRVFPRKRGGQIARNARQTRARTAVSWNALGDVPVMEKQNDSGNNMHAVMFHIWFRWISSGFCYPRLMMMMMIGSISSVGDKSLAWCSEMTCNDILHIQPWFPAWLRVRMTLTGMTCRGCMILLSHHEWLGVALLGFQATSRSSSSWGDNDGWQWSKRSEWWTSRDDPWFEAFVVWLVCLFVWWLAM